jgi:phytanoyl-CoA hydroxylase
MITDTQKQQWQTDFERDGYVAIRGFLNEQDMSELYDNLLRFRQDVLPTLPVEHVFYEDKDNKNSLKQIQQMQKHDDYFGQLFQGRFKNLAEVLMGSAVGQNMQYFNKPPLIGKPTPPHQDGYYFMLSPCEAVTMWLALDDVDEENGCVRYVRGSNHWGMRDHRRTKVLGFSQGIVDYGTPQDLEHEVAFPAQPGDLLVHHALTIHRADGNRSPDRNRQAMGFIYYSEDAKIDEDAHAAYQKKLAEEMKQSGKI